MKPTCRDCGSEDVAWGQAGNGAWVLYSTKPRLHLIECKARPKAKARPVVSFGGAKDGPTEGERKVLEARIAQALRLGGDCD